jgi:hypothetical protein
MSGKLPEDPRLIFCGALSRGDGATIFDLIVLFGTDLDNWPGMTFDQALDLPDWP